MSDDDRTMTRAELAGLAPQLDASPVARLHIEGHPPYTVTRRIVIGRQPDAEPNTDLISISGDQLVSKRHVVLDIQSGGLVVTDLGSSNGTTLVEGSSSSMLPSDSWSIVPDGAVLETGDTKIRVEMLAATMTPWLVAPLSVPVAVITTVPSPGAGVLACTTCGRDVVAAARFCDGCGSPTSPDGSAAQSAPPTIGQPLLADLHTGGPEEAPRRPLLVFVVAGLVVAVAVGTVAFGLVRRGNDGAFSSAASRVPSTAEEQWSVDVDGAADIVGDSSAVFVTAVDGGDAELYALDGRNGNEKWTSNLGRNQSYSYLHGVVDGVVIVQTCDDAGECEVRGVDRSNGETLWDDERNGYAVPSGDSLLWSEDTSLELLDPTTGERIESIRGDMVDLDLRYAYVRDDGELEVFEIKTLSSVFGPVQIDDDAVGAIFDGTNLITGVDDELVVIDSNGSIDRESRIPADEIYAIIEAGDDIIVLSTDDGVFGVRPVDGRAEEIWSADGSVQYDFGTDSGHFVVVTEDADGGTDADIIDARTGDVRISLRDYFDTNQMIGTNALVNSSFGDDAEATAYQFSDGEELWDSDFDGFVRLVDGAVVSIAESSGEVTLYR